MDEEHGSLEEIFLLGEMSNAGYTAGIYVWNYNWQTRVADAGSLLCDVLLPWMSDRVAHVGNLWLMNPHDVVRAIGGVDVDGVECS